MAKRTYTPKPQSPENALSAARAILHNARIALATDEKFLASVYAKGRNLPDGTIDGTDGLTIASIERQIASGRADVERAEKALAALEG